MKYHLPRYLDEPFKIMLWTVDELVVFAMPFGLMLGFFNAPLTGIVLGAVAMFGLKKLKGVEGHYFIYNLMYWHLPPIIRYHVIPASAVREWIG